MGEEGEEEGDAFEGGEGFAYRTEGRSEEMEGRTEEERNEPRQLKEGGRATGGNREGQSAA
jgi:hypothetical protein